jgi:hypothetical protein
LQLTTIGNGPGDLAEIAGAHVGNGARELRVVQKVEGFRAELQVRAFAKDVEREILESDAETMLLPGWRTLAMVLGALPKV